MRRHYLFLIVALLLAGLAITGRPTAARADELTVTSGTVTLAVSQPADYGYTKYTLSCASDAAGRVTAKLSGVYGTILRITTNPDDATAPTDDWDYTLKDEDGFDVAGGLGANRDTSNTESVCAFVTDGTNAIPITVAGDLNLAATNAGNAKKFKLTVILRR